jgi:hypothetical protein
MGLFKKNEKKLFEKKMVTVHKFRPVFTTVDGNTHIGLEYNYGIANRLRCSIPEYMMIDIKSDGYLKDHRKVMYPFANIISIDWQLVDEKEVEDKFSEYGIFVTTEEVEKYS